MVDEGEFIEVGNGVEAWEVGSAVVECMGDPKQLAFFHRAGWFLFWMVWVFVMEAFNHFFCMSHICFQFPCGVGDGIALPLDQVS